MITELFYSQILNINRGSLHTRSFRRIHFSVFRYRSTKNGFTGPKRFRGFRETGPWATLLDPPLISLHVYMYNYDALFVGEIVSWLNCSIFSTTTWVVFVMDEKYIAIN